MELKDLTNFLSPVLKITKDEVTLLDEKKLRQELIDKIIWETVFNPDNQVKEFCYWLTRALGQKLGLGPASIYDFYRARGEGNFSGLTVPAINIRGLTYDVARSIFKAARKNNTAALIFEIARSEMGYTEQKPAEYTACVLAAAIKENYSSPLFIQGDHFQVSGTRYKKDPEKEISGIQTIIKESLAAGFYNLDLDTSTLVDLSRPTIKEQQETNYAMATSLTEFIQKNAPKGITVSIGGEIGEIGGKNSTEEELRAYLDGYRLASLGRSGEKTSIPGLTKVAVQTGTTHGGVPLPGGGVAKVKLDFDTLERLGKVAQKEYHLAGVVQHGASTLPPELFDKFPQMETAEIHLATEFQNMIYDHQLFPAELKENINNWLKKECAAEKKEGDTEQQFLYKTRKKAFGPFKKDIWSLPEEVRNAISKNLEDKFSFLFQKLNVTNTTDLVKKYTKLVPVPVEKPVEEKPASPELKRGEFEGAD